MTVSKIIAAILAILGLGAAIQNFFLVPLLWKLIGIAVGAVAALAVIVFSLAKWARPHLGGGFRQRPSHRVKLRAGSAAVLAAVCLVFALVAYVVVRYNAISVGIVTAANTKVEFWIRGAIQGADKLTIQIPPPSRTKCVPIDAPGSGRYRADVVIVDWSTSNPHLELSNFFYPQLLGVQCIPSIEPDQIMVRVEPPTAEVFFPDRTYSYNAGIVIAGGVLWIVAFVVFWLRS